MPAQVAELLIADDDAMVLVFARFGETLALLRDIMRDKFGVSCGALLGPPADRRADVDAFRARRSCVLLLPYASRRSSGLNLAMANHVVLVDSAASAGEEDQAVGRAWRMGQTREVHTWHFAVADLDLHTGGMDL